jgi:membrane protein implicated in regulation of membrane protease activity
VLTLRGGLLLIAAVSIAAGALLLGLGAGTARAVGGWLLFEALLCLLFVLFERFRYRPRARNPQRLRPTGERMIDPTSGRLVEVWEDPATGEREYREVAS